MRRRDARVCLRGRLVKAKLRQALSSLRSERQLRERLRYDLSSSGS